MNATQTPDSGDLDSFDRALLTELRQVVSAHDTAPQRRAHRRPALAVAGIAAAAVSAFGISTLGASAAYAVERTDSGDIRISIHRLDDAAGLTDELASYGIDAEVDYEATSTTPIILGDVVEVPGGSQPGDLSFTSPPVLEDGSSATGDPQLEGLDDSPCGDPAHPPMTTDLRSDEYVITIPQGSALLRSDSELRISTTGQLDDTVAGLAVSYTVNGVQCGFGSMTTSAP